MKPLLAATAELEKIDFSEGVFCSPKLDGIRCIGINGQALSRSLKPIPNEYVQSVFASGLFDGFDGELIVGSATAKDTFRVTSSAIMCKAGEPDFMFHVFDCVDMAAGFSERLEHIKQRASNINHKQISLVEQCLAYRIADVETLETYWLAAGFEGVMIRSHNGAYKHGRSTVNEGILLKLKRFNDDEFEIIGFEERMQNTNKASIDALGSTVRSSDKAGLIGKGDLGAIILKHPSGQFSCGSGFNDEERKTIWDNQNDYLGKMAKIKHFAIGAKDLPRFPVWLGLRDRQDTDPINTDSLFDGLDDKQKAIMHQQRCESLSTIGNALDLLRCDISHVLAEFNLFTEPAKQRVLAQLTITNINTLHPRQHEALTEAVVQQSAENWFLIFSEKLLETKKHLLSAGESNSTPQKRSSPFAVQLAVPFMTAEEYAKQTGERVEDVLEMMSAGVLPIRKKQRKTDKDYINLLALFDEAYTAIN